MAITDAELAQMKALAEKVQYDGFVYPDEDDVIGMCSKVPRLIREVEELTAVANNAADEIDALRRTVDLHAQEKEELRAALKEMLHDWDQGAFLTRVALAKAHATLGEP